MTNWLNQGFEHIWLPYAQMKIAPQPLPVVDAEGVTLTLEGGKKLIDGTSSWWSVCHGYKNPKLVKAIQEQAEQLSHVMFAGLANEPAYKLADSLTSFAPSGLNRVFFSDSGSTSVEVAMKMAVQYWINQGKKHKNKFVAFRFGYHGDTMGAMSLEDTENGMHAKFQDYMPKQFVVDIPSGEYSFAEFEELITDARVNNQLAGVIIEPLVQGAGGMKFHTPDILAEIYRVTKEHDLLFIADEVATGFYRTGLKFACQEAGFTPDIMCLGKALTGGMLTMGATLCKDEIYDAFLSESLDTALLHGPTYMGNPLASAAALASLELFKTEPRQTQVEAIELQMMNELQDLESFKCVEDVRVKGAIGVVELKNADWDLMFRLREWFIKQGVWLRPFGNIIYIMPSFTIEKDELQTLTQSVSNAVEAIDKGAI